MEQLRHFASDNNPGIHPQMMKAIAAANVGHKLAYGDDVYTESAKKKFREVFGPGIEVFFVTTGTAANVVGLSAVTESFNSILCSEEAHIFVDECNAVENFVGCKLVPYHTHDAKLTVKVLRENYPHTNWVHQPRPRVLSITQPTELGTVYAPNEIRELADFAHERGLLLHMDGARLPNAAVTLGCSLKKITRDCGVDILSFGATKNGGWMAESIVFFDKKFTENANFKRKQATQLPSKMRFIAAQFEAMLSTGLWEKNARQANAMASFLADELLKVPKVKLHQKVEANVVFAEFPREYFPEVQKKYFFYEWGENTGIARLMCSFDTTKKDVMGLVKVLKEILG